MALEYDPAALQRHADRLLSRARWVPQGYPAWGVLIGITIGVRVYEGGPTFLPQGVLLLIAGVLFGLLGG